MEPGSPSRKRRRTLPWVLGLGVVGFAVVLLLLAWTTQPMELPAEWSPPADRGAAVPMDPGPSVPSTLRVSFRTEVAAVTSALEQQLPLRFGDLDETLSIEGIPGLSFAFEAERSPVEVEVVGDGLRLRTQAAYEARGRWESGFLPSLGGGCPVGGAPRPRMEVVVEVAPELTASGEADVDFRKVSVGPVSEGARDRCRLGGGSLDVTDVLASLVGEELDRVLPSLRSQLRSLDLMDLVESQWSRLESPILLAPEAWLVLSPGALSLGEVSGDGTALRVDAEVTLQPRVVLASDPPIRAERSRDPGSTPVPSHSAGPQGLRERPGSDIGRDGSGNGSGAVSPTPVDRGVQVEVLAGFDELTTTLSERLAGQVFEAAGREVEVREVEVWGLADGRLVTQLVLGRGFRGTLWMAGTPTLDPDDGSLSLPDLEVLLATRNPIAMLLARGFRGAVEGILREQARWPTARLLTELGMPDGFPLERELMPGFTLEGTVDQVSLEEVMVSVTGVRVVARARTQPAVRVTSLW